MRLANMRMSDGDEDGDGDGLEFTYSWGVVGSIG